eukprot:12371064-Karenia_brevis.AAC.1
MSDFSMVEGAGDAGVLGQSGFWNAGASAGASSAAPKRPHSTNFEKSGDTPLRAKNKENYPENPFGQKETAWLTAAISESASSASENALRIFGGHCENRFQQVEGRCK